MQYSLLYRLALENLMSRRNDTNLILVGKMGVGKVGVGEMGISRPMVHSAIWISIYHIGKGMNFFKSIFITGIQIL